MISKRRVVPLHADREVYLLDLCHRAEQLAQAHAPDRDIYVSASGWTL